MRMPSALFDWLRYTRSPVYLSDPDSAMLATPEEVAEATRGGAGAAARAPPGAPPRDLPVVVFSHGLGGMPGAGGEGAGLAGSRLRRSAA